MASIHVKVDDEFKESVADKAAAINSDMSAVVTALLRAWIDGRIPAFLPGESVMLARLPSDAELLFAISTVAQSAAIDDGMNSARYLPLVFSREIVDAVLDALQAYVWNGEEAK